MVTALPHILYLCVSLISPISAPYLVHSSGNACNRSHSNGVSLRILFISVTPSTSEAVKVKLGSSTSLMVRPFCLGFNLSGDLIALASPRSVLVIRSAESRSQSTGRVHRVILMLSVQVKAAITNNIQSSCIIYCSPCTLSS